MILFFNFTNGEDTEHFSKSCLELYFYSYKIELSHLSIKQLVLVYKNKTFTFFAKTN